MVRKKILITGGVGMIGKALIKTLSNKYNLIVLDTKGQIDRNKKFLKKRRNENFKYFKINILNKKKLNKYFKKVNYVIHLAAMLGVKNTEDNQKKCWKINFEGTRNVLEASLIHKAEKFIFSSSSEVYGEQKSKKKIIETSPLLGSNVYARSKIESEKLIIDKLHNKKTKFTILRLFNTYGENQVAQFFIPKLCYSVKYNKKFIINGNGSQVRSYAFCDDIAEGIKCCLLKKKSSNKIYNLGNSKQVFSLKKVAQKISKINKKKVNIVFSRNFNKGDRKKEREIYQRVCDIKKIKKELNYDPKINLSDGLTKVLEQKKIYKNWPT